MVSEGRGRLFRRKDGKYLIYLPLDFAEDSMFPFKEFSTWRKQIAHREVERARKTIASAMGTQIS